ncbi:dephospho-CoA kinase [Shewanella eurypsychrophilus]|uniref:Dephospho-CoA kinase n=1 Tax=Shewanella eurypsychrophilus TaxID=2593656 RepID=A0ABX6V1Q7_9GAMM|nr:MULTISPECIES: dephospho-CoA kinase [Shewanella]QFU21021.1 dephospho-CoA kinase [Shewanella sp. YLB-09]QPG56309.1 dephospho-CoA kinase [Shewanella eurypsychrophilus]
MSKFVVGLTGGIGSGKTTVANLFAEQGIDLVDADIVAREVVEIGSEGLNKLSEHFGTRILKLDSSLNRSALREIIFNNPTHRDWVNKLLHPLIRIEMLKQLDSAVSAYTILIAPLLFENDLDRLVNRTLMVDISTQEQVKRTSTRDSVSQEQVHRIIESQAPRAKKLQRADDVIDNHGEISALKSKVIALHNNYIKLSNNA